MKEGRTLKKKERRNRAEEKAGTRKREGKGRAGS